MSAVEDKVVEMKFLNSGFMQGATQALGMLSKLKSSLSFSSSGKNGLDEIQQSASRFSLQGILGATAGVQAAFAGMATVGITALANLTNRAVDAGISMTKSLTVDPISDGLSEYETNLNSIQTILANTQGAGSTLDDVNGALQELNTYSDQTIYNFSEMARNIGTFTAAGVGLAPATDAIKGIANLAALSGSNSQQASTAMYQLSQAISSGRVGLQDWNSVVNAGMGGAVFQRALATTAVNMGELNDQAVNLNDTSGALKINGDSFRNSISAVGGEPSWLTSDVLTKTLSHFTGDLTDAQLATEGFNAEQIKSIQQTAATAQDAATQVKTLSQVFDVAKETVGSGWAQTFQLIFGDFDQAKSTFTAVSTTINGFINASSKARNNLLKGFNELGGREQLIGVIGDAFKALQSILGPVADGFRKVFPPTTAAQLFGIVTAIRGFVDSLILGDDTAKNVKRTFAGFFAVIDIGKQIIFGLFGVIGDLIGSLSSGSGGVLEFTGNIGKFLVGLDKAIKSGTGLTTFFDGLSKVLQFPIQLITTLVGALFSIGSGADDAGGAFGRVADRLGFFGDIAGNAQKGLASLGNFFGSLGGKIESFAPVLAGLSKGLSDAIANAIGSGDYSGVFDALNSVVLGGIGLAIRKFLKGGGKLGLGVDLDVGGGLFKSITGSFGALTDTLTVMQGSIKAQTIQTIAIAVAILAASVVALSLIDSKKLTVALAAMSVGFAQLLGAMAILTKVTGSAGFVKVPAIAGAMLLLASAILVLSIAVKIFSSMSWEELVKGLGAVGVLLLGLSGAAQLMSKASGPLLRAGLAMIPLAIGLDLLAVAIKVFATMSWEEIAKGMVTLAASLGIIAVAMKLMPTTLPITAAGLTLVGVALNLIAASMKVFASMSWEEMGKGLAAIAGGLILIAGGMSLMPLTLPITAAGLLIVAIALEALAGVAKTFASMSWEDLGKAAAAMAGALVIIAGGLFLMSGTLAGSAALLIAAAALAVLTPVLVTLGSLSWQTIVTGLLALAGVFAVIGIAGLLLTPIILPIIGLGVALLGIGAGIALAGVGILALATAFSIFVAAGTAGVVVIGALVAQVPGLIIAFAKGVIGFVTSIGSAAGQMVGAFAKIIGAILSSLISQLPKIGQLFGKMITTVLGVIRNGAPQMVSTGIALVVSLLKGLGQNIGKMVDLASDLIVNFIHGLNRNAGKMVNAGIEMIINFVNLLAINIRAHQSEMNAAGVNLASAIVSGMVSGIGAGIQAVTDAAKRLAHSALDAAKNALGIHSPSKEFRKVGEFVHKGFAQGLGSSEDTKQAIEDFKNLLKDGISGAKQTIVDEKAKLKKLLKAKGDDRDPKAIAKAQKNIKEAQKEQKALQQSQNLLIDGLKKHQGRLTELGKEFDTNAENLKTKQDELKAAQDTLNSYNASVTSQYSALPTISTGTSVNAYIRNLQSSITKTDQFTASLNTLRSEGLDDDTYKALLAQGLDAQPFVNRLVAAGPDAVNSIKSLTGQLQSSAATLGQQSSTSLYQAGVDTAQGLVNGLLSEQANIESAMSTIATAMVKKMKHKLKIKSPSREFAEIGKFSSLGVAGGLTAYSGAAEKAAEDVGTNSLAVLKASMSKLNTAMAIPENLNPTITPVLDLTQVQKDANKVSSLLDTTPLKADVSYTQANDLLAATQATQAAQNAQVATPVQPVEKVIKFEQTNTSPKALSAIELYRQTQNLLSFAKEALSNS